MTLPDFLTQDPDGHIHITGSRIGLQDVIYYYNEGYSPEALLEAFPTLSLALVHRIVAFYLDDKVDVDAYMAACDTEMERQRAVTLRGPDVAEMRRRLAIRLTVGA